MPRREHTGGAALTQLSGNITASDLTFNVVDGSGYPTGVIGSFFVAIDPGKSTEEKVLCSSRSGNTFTVAAGGRGADNTLAVPHNAPAEVRHILAALEVDEHNAHVNQTTGVHGLLSAPVGLTDTQTLTNKTLSGSTNTITAVAQSSITNLVTDQTTQNNRLTTLETSDASNVTRLNTLEDRFIETLPAAPAVGTAPSGYPLGVSFYQATTGWPVFGILTMIRGDSTNRITQELTSASTGNGETKKFVREWGTGPAWTPWRELVFADERAFYSAFQAADKSLAGDTEDYASYTSDVNRGGFTTDGLTARVVVPKSGVYRIHFYATWGFSDAVAEQELKIFNATADGSSLGTEIRRAHLVTGADETQPDDHECSVVAAVNSGRAIVFRQRNGFPTTYGTLSGKMRGGFDIEYLGPQ